MYYILLTMICRVANMLFFFGDLDFWVVFHSVYHRTMHVYMCGMRMRHNVICKIHISQFSYVLNTYHFRFLSLLSGTDHFWEHLSSVWALCHYSKWSIVREMVAFRVCQKLIKTSYVGQHTFFALSKSTKN